MRESAIPTQIANLMTIPKVIDFRFSRITPAGPGQLA